MDNEDQLYSAKEAIIFSHKIGQLSKALWKSIEKDWQEWIKPYDLNINEHHILWIAYHLKGASISEIAKFGVMHVSTAFNFSKKLEERGYLTFSKKENDKRNTYVKLTEAGEHVLVQTLESYSPEHHQAYNAALPMREVYGKFPEMMDLMCLIRNIYGKDFMQIFDASFHNVHDEFTETDGNLTRQQKIESVNR